MISALAIGLLVLSPPLEGSATPNLEPCGAAAALDSFDLGLWSQLSQQLQLETPPAEAGGTLVARFLTLPGWDTDPEVAVSIYLPDAGDALAVSAHPSSGITAAAYYLKRVAHDTYEFRLRKRPRPVDVAFSSRSLPRELALEVQLLLMNAARISSVPDQQCAIYLHATSYNFVAWGVGIGRVCSRTVQPPAGSLAAELVNLGEELDRFALGGGDVEAVKSAIEKAASNPYEAPGCQG